MDDLLPEFIAETRETMEALSGEVIAWEADPSDRARLDAIFRFVHTVKGSCGFLDLPRLARLSHAAEDALAAVRSGERQPDTALVNAVLGVVDRIGELVEAIDAGVGLDDAQEDLLIGALAEDAQPAVPAAAAQVVHHRAASRSVRLGVELLDRMMNGMSDMVLARNELARRLRDSAVAEPKLEAALERLSLTVAELRDTVTRTRMQKIDALFSALPRVVRDTASGLGKAVQLQIDGSDVELDREMIETMRDPLVHIIRNAIDHGIEMPAERRARDKRETGLLQVSARQSGNQIILEITDDGAGIDVARVVAKAVAEGLIDEREAAALSPQARLDLVFAPGLSSRDEVTELSGRGVGMDVVRASIEKIGGRIALTNRPRHGLTIAIHMPLTLSILSTVVLGTANGRFAVSRSAVEEIVSVGSEAVRTDTIGGAELASVRGVRMPLVSLAALLGIEQPAEPRLLALVSVRDGRFALGIDAVLDAEELVIRPAAPAVMATGLYAGQTLPDSGLPMLLLDPAGLATAAGLQFAPEAPAPEAAEAPEASGTPALLFEDLDGCRRAIALAAVDRVETCSTEAIRLTGGQHTLLADGRVIPLRMAAPVGARTSVAVLRLTDGLSELAYAAAEAVEIVTLPQQLTPVRGGGPVGSLAVVEGAPVEVLDPLALFADAEVPVADPPVCLLHCDGSGWMNAFLRPTLEAAGYRCVSEPAIGQRVSVALAMEGAEPPACAIPVVRLRREREGSAGIYRYDRAALMAAVAQGIAA